MGRYLSAKQKAKIQNIFWIYITDNFIVKGMSGIKGFVPKIECAFVPITLANCHRVREFREEMRCPEYRNKLEQHEIGFFAESEGHIVGSIWASANQTDAPVVVRKYIRLMPQEGLIHDIVTSEKHRGMGIGPFMVSRLLPSLLCDYRLEKITIDVNIKNHASLRMMEKAGLIKDQRMLSVSACRNLIMHITLRRYH